MSQDGSVIAEYPDDRDGSLQLGVRQVSSRPMPGAMASRDGMMHFQTGPQTLSPQRVKTDAQRFQDNKLAEKVYRLIFHHNAAGGQPQLTDLGKQAVPMAQVPANTLYKRTLESFQQEFADDKMANLHFNHHTKRRLKHLLKLNDTLKRIREGQQTSMPALPGSGSQRVSLGNDPAHAYATAKATSTTRNVNAKKNSALMFGLAQRAAGSKSVAMRTGSQHTTLLGAGLLDGRASSISNRPTLIKSGSGANIGATDEKLQRSQVNIDKKMREDFDRLQKQLSKRQERENLAQEQIKFAMEERVHKANAMATKGEAALEKVKRQQRLLERQSVKTYKASIQELGERQQKVQEDENVRARRGQKDLIQRERAIKARHDREEEDTDQTIVHSLYSLEVKLKVGQERAKNWQVENIKGKAQNHNKRVEQVKGFKGTAGASSNEQLEIDRLNKVVQKQQKMEAFSKQRREEDQYNNAQRNQRAQVIAQKVEQVKRAQRRQELQAKRKVDNKDATTNERTTTIKSELDRQAAYKKEAARLRAEEQQEARENEAYQKELRKYQILEKHLNMQQKLDYKKQMIGTASIAALENGMQRQIARQEEKKERERERIAAEKAAAKAAKKPKKQDIEPIDL